jgi:hypothetical protein
VVHVTAIRPSCVAHTAVCSVAMLPCLLFVDACSTDDPVPAPPTWPSAWNCTCTAPMTDGLKLPGCALRCHIRRRGRTGVRPCAALRSHLLPFHRQVNQQEGKKSECVQGLFFLSGFAPLAGHAANPKPPRRCRWSSARLYCGAVLWLGQSAALPSLSTADAIRTRRPWLGSQPWARRESKHLANLITTAPPRTD